MNSLERLEAALKVQRNYISSYEQPSEVLSYETLRALDDLFLRDLMEPTRPVEENERHFRALSTWGVNHALRRIVPKASTTTTFRNFPSYGDVQAQADDFIFHCALLELGERYAGWLSDGILIGEVRSHTKASDGGPMDVLVLKAADRTYSSEEIGMAGLRWSGDRARAVDRGRENRLEKRHRKVARDLNRRVDLIDNWYMTYSTSEDIDLYFAEWAKIYLRRIYSQDMVGEDDHLGGRPFSRYLEVLAALSARSQKHIAYAAILRARYPSADIRNLLTTYADRDYFLTTLAGYMDAGRDEIEIILSSLTLHGENLDVHTVDKETAWAPLVQASKKTLMMPIYGLDINPFLFLLNDLKFRYEGDWFKAANNRETRWMKELKELFAGPRWQTHDRNLKLRSDGKVQTDIDFAIFDRRANEVAVIQLKWQQPVGMNNRVRRSTGKNFVTESNRWIEKVTSWIDRYGADELMNRLGFVTSSSPSIHLFVLGRYHAHFSGFDGHDMRATWSDWAHFQRIRAAAPGRSVSQLSFDLRSAVQQARTNSKGESTMFPVGDLALVINPLSEPVSP